MEILNEINWIFYSEGNIQLVFQYYNETICNKDRIINPESSIILSEEIVKYNSCKQLHSHINSFKIVLKIPKRCDHNYLITINHSEKYYKRVIARLFSDKYIDNLFQTVHLPKNMIKSLVNNIKIHQIRCYSDIETLLQHVNNTNTNYYGFIEKDLRFLYSHSCFKMTLSIEIKVKCGLTSISPLVRFQNKIKYRLSRYKLMKLYKCLQKQRNYGNIDFISEYNPCDLCSNNISTITNAIKSLLINKYQHNQIKILLNDLINKKSSSFNTMVDYVTNFLSIGELNSSLSNNFLICLLSHVIHNELILKQLEVIQGFDLLDIEGIALVYNKLIQLVSLEHTHNETILEIVNDLILNYLSNPIDDVIIETIKILNNIRKGKIENFHISNEIFDKLIQKNFQFLIEFINFIILLHNDITLYDELYEQSSSWINQLQKNQCLLLIQLWFTSLISKDASVIFTFQLSNIVQYNDIPNDTLNLDWNIDKLTNMDIILPGYIKIQLVNNINDIILDIELQYSIGITDISLKPLDKIIHKNKLEDNVCQVVNNYLNKF